MKENLLMVFAKEPVPGQVKTRLASTVGDEIAALIYENCMKFVIDSTISDNYETVIYKTKDSSDEYFKGNFPFCRIEDQVDGDLGTKMQDAFSREFKAGYKKIIIIGTDCPEINQFFINEVFAIMNHKPNTIGPADDGGYYMLGMSELQSSLFEDIRWSSQHVLADTIKKATLNNLDMYQLPCKSDIDTEEDLRKYITNNAEAMLAKLFVTILA